jgi:hypothetical protein
LNDPEGALQDLEKGLDETVVRYVVPELAPQVLLATPELTSLCDAPRFQACVTATGKHPTEHRGCGERSPQPGARDPGDP